ncbi:unnamed protein product, partial [Mesorhabditis belari]|uniref:SSD domain-containing protein n=1 Tax=Mesorhabditis belari TaxID=2138241 RepID=A0AAF3J689_9BILA
MFWGSALQKRTPPLRAPLQRITRGFNNCLHNAFARIGFSIGSHPVLFFLLFLILLSFSAGIFRLRFSTKLQYGFISTRARAIAEQRVHDEFHGHNNDHFQHFIVSIQRRDHGNLLNVNDLNTVLEIEEFISKTFSVFHNGHEFVHKDLCRDRCQSNQLLYMFKKIIDEVETENVLIDHPKSRYNDAKFLVAHHLHGVRRKDEEELIPYNTPLMRSNKTKLSKIEMISLYYEAPLESPDALSIITEWETGLMKWSQIQSDFPDFSIDVMGDKALGQEMQRGGMTLIPHMAIGFMLTLIFVTITVTKKINAGIKDVIPVTIIVIGVLLAPIGAVLFTFGITGWLYIEIYPILIVLPTLVISIGVDDAFLALHCWSNSMLELDKMKQENHLEAIPALLSKVLVEVGPSMLLTSLTNCMAFAVGAFFAPPAIQVFSIVAAIAMLADFVFEIVCFCSLLALSGRFYKSGSLAQSRPTKLFSNLMFRYSRIITKRPVQFVIMSVTAMFFAFSVYGAFSMTTQINSTRIIPSDSPLQKADGLLRKYIWAEFEPALVYVNSPPNIADEKGYHAFKTMVEEFEALPRCIGANATMLWLNDYELAMSKVAELFSTLGLKYFLDYQELPYFMKEIGGAWNSSVKWHLKNAFPVVDAFVFYIGFHNATTWNQRAENMNNWRAVADRWKQFNVTVFSENSAVYDGIFNMGPTTYQTAAFTLASMVIVCLFFVPSFIGVCSAAFAISSISIGVFGGLSWLGFDLDPITMVAIVMSIGFSVDYTAHICYHFHRAHSTLPPRSLPADYVYSAINSVGIPMLQAAASTVICFIPVTVHPDYTPEVFVTTIIVVVLLGLLHGFVILPSMLALIPNHFFDSNPETRRNTVPMVEEKDDSNIIVNSPNKTGVPLLPEI